MRTFKHLWSVVLLLTLVFTGCKKDEEPDVQIQQGEGLFVINEGNFGLGNASLSYYYIEKDSMVDDFFTKATGRPLGDVFQSMANYNGKLFFVVNVSNKIEVMDSINLTSVKTITGISSPRNLFFYNNKMYVTTASANKIYIYNASTLEKSGEIDIDGFTEKMVLVNGKLVVTVQQYSPYPEGSKKGIIVINPSSDAIEKYVELKEGAYDIVTDVNNKIWVMCAGDYDKFVNGALYKINPSDFSIEQKFDFDGLAYFGNALKLSADKSTLYYIVPDPSGGFTEYDIYKTSVNASTLPSTPFYNGVGKYIYGYGVDEKRGDLYILDAITGSQKGNMIRLDINTLAVKSTKEVGYFPNNVVFK